MEMGSWEQTDSTKPYESVCLFAAIFLQPFPLLPITLFFDHSLSLSLLFSRFQFSPFPLLNSFLNPLWFVGSALHGEFHFHFHFHSSFAFCCFRWCFWRRLLHLPRPLYVPWPCHCKFITQLPSSWLQIVTLFDSDDGLCVFELSSEGTLSFVYFVLASLLEFAAFWRSCSLIYLVLQLFCFGSLSFGENCWSYWQWKKEETCFFWRNVWERVSFLCKWANSSLACS